MFTSVPFPALYKNFFSKTYVQALIGRMVWMQLDIRPVVAILKCVNGKGESMTFENRGK